MTLFESANRETKGIRTMELALISITKNTMKCTFVNCKAIFTVFCGWFGVVAFPNWFGELKNPPPTAD